MASPVNHEFAGNNYEVQQCSSYIPGVPQYSLTIDPPLMTQSTSPEHIVQVGSPVDNASNIQQLWTVMVPQAYSPDFYEAFLKGKPKALGILVIIVAILVIALGILSYFTASVSFFILSSFWGPMFYIISGSLTVAAQTKASICLVQGSLAMNVISCLASLSATVLNVCELIFNQCFYGSSNYYLEKCPRYPKYGIAVISLLLVANVLLFFVTLSTSIFGCISMSKFKSTFRQFLLQEAPRL